MTRICRAAVCDARAVIISTQSIKAARISEMISGTRRRIYRIGFGEANDEGLALDMNGMSKEARRVKSG